MPPINGRELRRMTEAHGPEQVSAHLTEALQAGHLNPDDFSLRDLAENLVPDGREWVASLNPRYQGLSITEAAAVNTAQFSNITGQIVYSKILQGFNDEAFVFSQIIPTVPTQFSGEKIPGISQLGDQAEIVSEGEAYPRAGVAEDYIETPSTLKRGFVVEVTKEAVFFDRTNLVLRRAGAVGQELGRNKEKRIIDCVVDENTTAHRYKWKGNVIATYGDNSGTHTWDNLAASNGLTDYTDIDGAEQLLAAMVDPYTDEPIMVMADTIIVCPELEATAWRIANAILVAQQVGGFATSGNLNRTDSPSPTGRNLYSANYRIVSSRLLPARLGTNTSWFLGKPSEAFAYMENWPITVSQAPANSTAEFERDIIAQFKASERGAAATLEPRYMVKSTA